jgi:hypothetical protein
MFFPQRDFSRHPGTKTEKSNFTTKKATNLYLPFLICSIFESF